MKKYRAIPEVKQHNKEYMKEYQKKYNSRHEVNQHKKAHWKERYLVDFNFAVKFRLRALLRNALNRYSSNGKLFKANKYGIDYNACIEKLKPFPENLKEFDIDHIKPLSSFDLNNPEEIKKAFAPENLQWLPKEINRHIKRDKLNWIDKN